MEKKRFLIYSYILLAALVSIYLFPVMLEPLDSDVFYHLQITEHMVKEKTLYFLHEPWFHAPEGKLHTYPPVFHWLLAITSLGGMISLDSLAVFYQLIFYPLALLSSFYLIRYLRDEETAFISVIILSTFFPFFGRTHMAIPEALQHVLIPLVLLSYYRNKPRISGIVMALMLANHLYDSLFLFLVISLHYFFYKKDSFNYRVFAGISLFGMIFQLWGIHGHLSATASADSTHHFKPTYYYRMLLAIVSVSMLFITSAYSFYRKKIGRRNILLYWFLATGPILILLPYRFPAYAALPLSFFTASLIKDLLDKQIRAIIVPGVLVLIVATVPLSYTAYPLLHDFRKPGVNENEARALSWIENNISDAEIIGVMPKRTRYEGYRIAYYTSLTTTENLDKADYLYSAYREPEGNWSLLKKYGQYRVYERD